MRKVRIFTRFVRSAMYQPLARKIFCGTYIFDRSTTSFGAYTQSKAKKGGKEKELFVDKSTGTEYSLFGCES